MNDSRKLKWIDGAKFIAILAVMIDHTTGILYHNEKIRLMSFFSVSLFILLSGITSWENDKGKGGSPFEEYFLSIKKIMYAYFIATFFYQIIDHKFFDLNQYIYYIIHFNASGPFYFVLLYLQLMLFRRPFKTILKAIKKNAQGVYLEGIILMFIIGISCLTTAYSNVLGVYGGGGKLFGGTYLILFYTGMLFAKHHVLEETSERSGLLCRFLGGGGGFLWILWISMSFKAVDSVEMFIATGRAMNPPGLIIMISACLMMLFTYGLFGMLDRINLSWLTGALEVVYWLGRHTLYMFLYHRFFLDYFLIPYVMIDNIWLKRIVYLIVMIGGSMLIEKAVTRFTLVVKGSFN